MKQQALKSASTEHEGVYHAARSCQAAALSLTAAHLRGLKKACSLESQKTAGFLAAQKSEGAVRAHRVDLGGEPGMSPLRRLKGRSFIAGVGEPHGVDNAYPHVRQSSHGHRVALALGALALVVSQRPGLFQSRLPGELIERVAQGLQAMVECAL